MIDEIEVQTECNKYGLHPKIFVETDTIQIDTPLDSWLLIVDDNNIRPICIMHQNKCRNIKKYHYQRSVNTIYQAIDSIMSHKKVLKGLWLTNTYKNNNGGRNVLYS